jgi:signal peptidase
LFPATQKTGVRTVTPRSVLTGGLEIVAATVVVSLVAGQVIGTPVLLSYVETGSMSPTMEPGDGFVAVPAAVTDDPEPGDVIVFQAEEIQGGGLTTHRVVAETDRGYVTRGDDNPFTDQDGGEPPVKDAQIVAEALRIGGSVVVVPQLGSVVLATQDALAAVQRTLAATLGTRSLLGTQGLAYILLGVSAVLYVIDLVFGGRRSGRERGRSRDRGDSGVSTRLLLVGFAAEVVGSATAAMAVPAGTQEYGVVSAEFDSDRPTVIRQGETASVEYPLRNGGVVPVYVYLEPASEGVSVTPTELRLSGRSEAAATLELTAPEETGYYRRYLAEHRYLAVLPRGVTDALYGLHPWLPIVAIDGLLAALVYVPGRLLVDEGRLRVRRRNSRPSASIGESIRNWLFG